MGNIIPLFETLIDSDTETQFEKVSKRISTLAELQNSIEKDLSRLLNTRVSNVWKACGSESRTPFSYGVNITAPTSAENVFEIQDLEARIDDVIKSFEPRLTNAKSRVVGFGKDPSTLFVNIEAVLSVENRRVQLSFPVVIDA
ncbi:MAG: type VI secretion system baseplate subunit TssE [Holosporaceae bacterium]|jgi:type VI secretion system lysozyme-like protein|nr:type VI secretion system baseplate subunit TssE [Holosporaceae bacterium]